MRENISLAPEALQLLLWHSQTAQVQSESTMALMPGLIQLFPAIYSLQADQTKS